MKQPILKKIKPQDIIVTEQVRKNFKDNEIFELKESIKEKGLLQPIGLNNINGTHYLIFGERRFRAFSLMEMDTKVNVSIDAMVYENLKAEEVLELQIIENLQRKDVSPMEECKAYINMVEIHNLSIGKISARVGKDKHYIASRIKLSSLILPFQELLMAEKMSLNMALKLAKLADDTQRGVYEDCIDDDDAKEETYYFIISDSDLDSYKGELKTATFSLKDSKLTGLACVSCSNNTAFNTLLFPEEAKNPKCMNLTCFNDKTKLAFGSKMKKALTDTSIILCSSNWSKEDEDDAIEKEFGKVYTCREYNKAKIPTEPIHSEYEERFNNGYYEDKDEMEGDFNDDIERYNEELEEYNEIIKAGGVIKAFLISGNNKGKIIDVILTTESTYQKSSSLIATAKGFSEAKETGKVTSEMIDAEMSRIKISVLRKNEIEDQKISKGVYELLMDQESYNNNGLPLKEQELIGLIISLYNSCIVYSYGNKQIVIDKLIEMGFGEEKKELALWDFLCKMKGADKSKLLNFLSRHLILLSLKKHEANFEKDDEAISIYSIANEYNKRDVEKIVNKVCVNRKKRDENFADSMKKLEKQKKEIVVVKTKKK